MSNVDFKKGLSEEKLQNVNFQDGQILFNVDTGALYIDAAESTKDNKRTKVTDPELKARIENLEQNGLTGEYLDKQNPTGSGSLSLNRLENSTVGNYSVAIGDRTLASGKGSTAEGCLTEATGNQSHAEGDGTKATAIGSHSEGGYSVKQDGTKVFTTSSGNYAHAEGAGSVAEGDGSHAEGIQTLSTARGSHTEGNNTEANAEGAHAEGVFSKATNTAAHSEGYDTEVSGYAAHTEGLETKAQGNYSHAEGTGTIAQWHNQHVQGRYNEELTEEIAKTLAHVVGGGTYNDGNPIRKNIHTLDWNGNADFAGDVTATKEDGTKVSLIDVAENMNTDIEWNDINNKPEIPTKTSELTNDSNFIALDSDFVSDLYKSLDGKVDVYLQEAYDCNTLYDTGIYKIKQGTNCPSGAQYGTLLVMSYEKTKGNIKPVYCSQIFIPCGDDTSKPNSMFYRTALDTTWNPWQEIINSNNTLRLDTNGTPIPEGTDLNNLTTVGNYFSGYSGHAQTLLNCPITGSGFRLIVMDGYGANATGQLIISYGSNIVYRGYENSSSKWGDWVYLTNTYSTFVKSGSGAKSGLVPAPSTTAGTTKYLREDGTWQVPPTSSGTDTKNTAGASNTSSKIYLVGATSQGTNPQTYTHDTAYVGTDGCLYSNSQKTLTNGGATGSYAVALGYGNSATGNYSIAEGYYNTATGNYSHVEGMYNGTAEDSYVEHSLHSSSKITTANSCGQCINGTTYAYIVILDGSSLWSEIYSMANGVSNTYISGALKGSNGVMNKGIFSFSCSPQVFFWTSSISGISTGNTITSYYTPTTISTTAIHVQGKYAKIDNNYAHVVGNGSSTSSRSNAHTLDWNGNAWYAGGITSKGNIVFQDPNNIGRGPISLIKNIPFIIAYGNFTAPGGHAFSLNSREQFKIRNVWTGLNYECGSGGSGCGYGLASNAQEALLLVRVVGYEYASCQYKPFSLDFILSTSTGTGSCEGYSSMSSTLNTPLNGNIRLYLTGLSYNCGNITGTPTLNIKTSSSNIHICEIALMP